MEQARADGTDSRRRNNIADINVPDVYGCTALHYSVRCFDNDNCRAVIKALSISGIRDGDNSALGLACAYRNFVAATLIAGLGPRVTENSDPTVPQRILQFCLYPLECPDPDGTNFALQVGLIQSLVREHRLHLDKPATIGYYAVVAATARRTRPAILQTLLELGARAEYDTRLNPRPDLHAGTAFQMFHHTAQGITPLIIAVRRGDFVKAKLLLDRGADVNKTKTIGSHVLFQMWIVWAGNAADDAATLWPLLLWRGAGLDSKVTWRAVGGTPLG